MKKYDNLGELLTDYRKHNKLSQADLGELLDVDTRTISRWEKNETLIKPEKEKEFVEKLLIPYQVIRNLNSDNPIAIYYNLENRTYSFTSIMKTPLNASWYKADIPFDTSRIRLIHNESDIQFVEDIQEMNKNPKQINPVLLKEAAKILPELNLILHDQSGFYAGHMTILPLKYEAYRKLRDQEMMEGSLSITDLTSNFTQAPLVFYYYSIYADSMDNTYYLVNRLLAYFKEKQFKDYIFAGISYREKKVEILKEMGLKVMWEKPVEEGSDKLAVFLEGNLDMFIFGKTL
jgi:transcriptional regulator with XRE-family HTH domain